MIDLTGWMPHEGGDNPTLDKGPKGEAPAVRVLLRGRPDTGPREAGPAPSTAFVWLWHPGQPTTDLPAEFVRDEAMFAAGDVIAWRLDADPTPFTRYDHVRKDLGL